MHMQWRDCQEWRSLGVPLSTTSNEVAKLYDAVVTQLLSYRDIPNIGGFSDAVYAMKQTDPAFVIGYVLGTGLPVMMNERMLHLDSELQTELDAMLELSKAPTCNFREQRLVKAVIHWANREHRRACEVFEDILLDHPRDALTIVLSHLGYLFMGDKRRHGGLVSKVMSHWDPSMPHYGFLQGIRSFGLVENNYFVEAKKHGLEALEIYPGDCWATHSLAHVYDMSGRSQKGREFLARTESHWQGSGALDHHNYWHWALMDLDQADYESALHIFDNKVKPPALRDKSNFCLIDATSLLKRMELEGVDIGDRWQDLDELIRPRIDSRSIVFDDLHLLMASRGTKQKEMSQHILDSVQEFMSEGQGDTHRKMKSYGADILHAVVAYEAGDYAHTVELLNPVRYQFPCIGGSLAQSDILNLLLIHAALQSPLSKHHKLARQLISERQTVMSDSPMTQRLMTRAMACHID